jgi:large subunit ribosomal protein L30
MAKTANKKIQIKLVKSLIGCSEAQKKVAKALGFSKKDQVVEHEESPIIMGMVNKISHLLEITK